MVGCNKNTVLGQGWTLQSMYGQDVIDGTQITMTFLDSTAEGKAGCNYYSVKMELDGEEIRFREGFKYDLGCFGEGLMEQEKRYMRALNDVSTFAVSDQILEMKDDTGRVVLNFLRGLPDGYIPPAW